ncbi:hypothetical protein JOD18_004075 [Gracilibacillus alcaliphilus]|nr:hypothetical protein [Gracilibacillus alcaliphilus]
MDHRQILINDQWIEGERQGEFIVVDNLASGMSRIKRQL